MRDVTVAVILVLSFASKASARELVPHESVNPQDSMSKLADKLTNRLATQADVDLDNTMLGKPSTAMRTPQLAAMRTPQLGVNTVPSRHAGDSFMAATPWSSTQGSKLMASGSVGMPSAIVRAEGEGAPAAAPGTLRITLKSYDAANLEKGVQDICEMVMKGGGKIVGPVGLKARSPKYLVLRSPHVYKTSREQFQRYGHKKFIDIKSLDRQVLEGLLGLEPPPGVDIQLALK